MGNFSDDTFDELHDYVSLRLQQGVPLIDADWNELDDVRRYELKNFIQKYVGNGVPANDDGFKIVPIPNADDDFIITSGRCLVEGWEVVNRTDNLQYTKQILYENQAKVDEWNQGVPDNEKISVIPKLAKPASDMALVYLDVWEREINPEENKNPVYDKIGIQSCVRKKREWAVRVLEHYQDGNSPTLPVGHEFYPLARLNRTGIGLAFDEMRLTGLTLSGHCRNYSNPHHVTPEQIGAIPNTGGQVYGELDVHATNNGDTTKQGMQVDIYGNDTGSSLGLCVFSGGNGTGYKGGINCYVDGSGQKTAGSFGAYSTGTDPGMALSATANCDGDGNVTGASVISSGSGTGTVDGIFVQTYGDGTGTKQGIRSGVYGKGNKYAGIFSANSEAGTDSTMALLAYADGAGDGEVRGSEVSARNSGSGIVRGLSTYSSSDGTGNVYALTVHAYGTGAGARYGIYSTVTGSSASVCYGGYFSAYGSNNYAGYFEGNVHVAGTLSKTSGQFLIDHPLDPRNKILRHSFVESPEDLCLYRGKVSLDGSGVVVVTMPDYFAALTKEEEATVMLTAIGKIPFTASYEWNKEATSFTINGKANGEVSYLVLANRDDPAVRLLRRPVEEKKGEGPFKQGKLLCPEAYGEPRETGPEPKDVETRMQAPAMNEEVLKRQMENQKRNEEVMKIMETSRKKEELYVQKEPAATTAKKGTMTNPGNK